MKNHSDEMIFHSQGLRRSAANLEDRIGEIANLKVHIRKTFKCEFHLACLRAKRFDMEVRSMKYLLTGAEMAEADRATSEVIGIPSIVLMERAALAVTRTPPVP